MTALSDLREHSAFLRMRPNFPTQNSIVQGNNSSSTGCFSRSTIRGTRDTFIKQAAAIREVKSR